VPCKATDDSIDNLDDSSMFSQPTSKSNKNMGSHSRSFVNLSNTNINGFDNKASRGVPDLQR
jgi:hypothetical protein